MARKLRVEYSGAIYHVMNRGDRREAIFIDDSDRGKFIETLAETCAKTDWQVHAYCLMTNHFHLVIETPGGNLVAGMKWLLGTFTSRFNRRHKLSGHLFSGRYKALIVDGSGTGYLRTACEYVHLNPARAKLLQGEEPLRNYRWSSYPDYLRAAEQRPAWLRVDRLLGESGIPQDSEAGRREFENVMEQRRRMADGIDYDLLRGGWYVGSEAFRDELLAQMHGRFGEHHYGKERAESAEEKAERIICEHLQKANWTEADLSIHAKAHPIKVELALQLRCQTTMTLKWIAQRLQTGSWRHLNRRLYETRKASKEVQVRN